MARHIAIIQFVIPLGEFLRHHIFIKIILSFYFLLSFIDKKKKLNKIVNNLFSPKAMHLFTQILCPLSQILVATKSSLTLLTLLI